MDGPVEHPGDEYRASSLLVEKNAPELFAADPTVRTVGLAMINGDLVFRVVRNRGTKEAFAFGTNSYLGKNTIDKLDGLSVVYRDVSTDPVPLAKVPFRGPGSPGVSSFGKEQEWNNPLCCGVQIQNFDHDTRTQAIANNFITIGTLGCFVRTSSNETAIITNNHVIAGENLAQIGDKILHPGSGVYSSQEKVGELLRFESLQFSPAGASPKQGNAILNDCDVAIAKVDPGISIEQKCLTYQGQALLSTTRSPQLGDSVYKVGRTSGPSRGTITEFAVVLRVHYDNGQCWFRRAITIEGDQGTRFSDRGDSGAVIVDSNTNEVVGILFAGNDKSTYACPIGPALSTMSCGLL